MPTDSPHVESFVLRFVQDAPENGASQLHVVVVHVQSNEEKTFTDFADAVAFISRYVPLGDFAFNKTKDERRKTENVRSPSSVLGQSGE